MAENTILAEAKSIIEAVLFAADRPVSVGQLAGLLEMDFDTVESLILELQQEYDTGKHSFQIQEIANGFQICTRSEYANWIKKYYTTEVSSRLTTSALEALAIIAYKQPATRADVEEIRGVNSDGVIRTLLERKLINIVGRKDAPGRPMMYGTTDDFLIHFGLKDISDLPAIEELDNVLGKYRTDNE
ncbi:TPA: SMC-Scp complex subunit ScpB [bacterium]|nr:SMC-Scp complex subunit ScpB [bacterium]